MKMQTLMMGGIIANTNAFKTQVAMSDAMFAKKLTWYPLFTKEGKNAGQIQIQTEFIPNKNWGNTSFEGEGMSTATKQKILACVGLTGSIGACAGGFYTYC